jgi:hypothetical protein
MLTRELDALERKAKREGLRPAVRLNGTSDLAWESMPVVIDGARIADSILRLYPGVTFYGYTKSIARAIGAPQRLTFSRSERTADATVRTLLQAGVNVATVFGVKPGQPLPVTWNGAPVLDGDEHDFRFLDSPGHVVGLRAKGKARRSDRGFIA